MNFVAIRPLTVTDPSAAGAFPHSLGPKQTRQIANTGRTAVT
jgi:hypothetical protein